MDWIYEFPFIFPVDLKAIDDFIKSISVRFGFIFDSITNVLKGFVSVVYILLNAIPWFVIIIVIVLLGWKVSKKITKGVLYGALIFLIGSVGYWKLMNETLSVTIVSVIISLLFGFPLGIFASSNERIDKLIRPLLDSMQTMPVFVYLIPAILFFGLGEAPAVIATTIYAIVPIIRMTNHGIRQVDKEVTEASKSFGSTKMQSLIKVQIPQALPTIMTGVNQTIMMAISMVVTTSMIGMTGLGMEVLIGVNRIEIGRGLISGTAVVIIAVILDRLTQGLSNKKEVKSLG
ncbi:MAG TPA: ABC transporter permease subunit [Oscillospiraceae bacterium]|nr:ABC transporter permease subunit [Oscillospiraceae bacterium]